MEELGEAVDPVHPFAGQPGVAGLGRALVVTTPDDAVVSPPQSPKTLSTVAADEKIGGSFYVPFDGQPGVAGPGRAVMVTAPGDVVVQPPRLHVPTVAGDKIGGSFCVPVDAVHTYNGQPGVAGQGTAPEPEPDGVLAPPSGLSLPSATVADGKIDFSVDAFFPFAGQQGMACQGAAVGVTTPRKPDGVLAPPPGLPLPVATVGEGKIPDSVDAFHAFAGQPGVAGQGPAVEVTASGNALLPPPRLPLPLATMSDFKIGDHVDVPVGAVHSFSGQSGVGGQGRAVPDDDVLLPLPRLAPTPSHNGRCHARGLIVWRRPGGAQWRVSADGSGDGVDWVAGAEAAAAEADPDALVDAYMGLGGHIPDFGNLDGILTAFLLSSLHKLVRILAAIALVYLAGIVASLLPR